ncbi:MAG TPA: ABC transporter permease [Vicinamibacterales bacterium]|nr:ABC transporter permease [Vicinamibacterales bacterium]
MRWRGRLIAWWARWRRSRFERDMAAELQFHLEQRASDLVDQGVDPDAARRRASLEFGGVEGYKERCRDAWGWRLVADLRADVLYGVRRLRASPGFASAAILSLALGVGANPLVFSVVSSFLMRPLPVERPGELFFLEEERYPTHSFPLYRDLRDRAGSVASLAAYRIAPINLSGTERADRVWGYLATGNYFDLLGVTPAHGRFFGPADDRQPGAHPVAVLSHDCWRTRFLGDPSIVGRTITINGGAYTVLGIAPPGFYGTERFYHAEIWVPMIMQAQIEPGNAWLETRNTSNAFVIGRARSGTSFDQIAQALNGVGADLVREYPDNHRVLRFKLASPGLVGDMLGAPVRAFTLGVQTLAGLVLIVACLNVAGVLLARGADRARELAIRLSIGAGRGRIVRQLLTESLLIAVAGGAAGVALAVAGARLIRAWRAPGGFPIALDVTLDATVLVFAAVISTLAAVVFGLAPARQAARTDPNAVLKGTPDAMPLRRRRWAFQDLLVGMQVTLCCVLVAACLLSLVGLRRALTLSIGFNPRGVAMAGIDLALAGYDRARADDFQRRALEAARTLPGVESAAYANSIPLSIDQSTTRIRPDDQPDGTPPEPVDVSYYQVSPSFFRTMGTRMLDGREINWSDSAGAPRVAVVNVAFARAVMRTSTPVGRRFRYGRDGAQVEVVGLVEDGKYRSLSESPRPAIFWSILQSPNATTTLLVRSSLPEEHVTRQLQTLVATLDPSLPVHGAGSLIEMLRFVLLPSRAAAIALGVFGALAMTLAAVGLHGVVAYAVSRRQRELGIRIAIGAGPVAVLRLVLGRMGWLIGLGAAAGLTLVFAGADLLQAIVLQASPRDPQLIGAVVLSIVLLAMAACWSPARRALRATIR